MERRGKQMRGRLEAVSCTEGSLTPGLADAASVVRIEARLKHDKHKGVSLTARRHGRRMTHDTQELSGPS